MRGPVPKRSDQRRYKPDGPPPERGKGATTESWRAYAESIGVDVPYGAGRNDVQSAILDATRTDEMHPLAREWLDALALSGQSHWYEPSDWATAKVLAHILSAALTAGRMNASLIERWQSGATELLTTEGARRRVRIELAQAADGDQEEDARVAVLSDARNRLRLASS